MFAMCSVWNRTCKSAGDILASFPGRSHVHDPVFDRLQYANTEGESLGDLVTCGYVRQTEGRHTGGGARRGISKHFLV